jgi:shikimate kinase
MTSECFPGVDRVLLVGFMGSGKSTVGRLLAQRLGWSFLDFDEEIEVRLGRQIPAIFEVDGEAFFRARESEVGRDLLGRTEIVLASGGGWPAGPGNWEMVPPGTLSIWLEVTQNSVQERVGGDAANRPLLAKTGLFSQARTLMSERIVAYERADHRVATDSMTPEQVAEITETLVRNRSKTDKDSERMSN